MDPKVMLVKSMYIFKTIEDANLLKHDAEGHIVRKEIQELREAFDSFILSGGKNVHHSK